MMKTASELRETHPQFVYKKYQWSRKDDSLVFEWHFEIRGKLGDELGAEWRELGAEWRELKAEWRELEAGHHDPDVKPAKLQFSSHMEFTSVAKNTIDEIGSDTLNAYAFNLGLAEMLSYWKLTASPDIVVEAGHLSEDQAQWWHQLLTRGMGEYFFKNKIDFTAPNFVSIKSTANDSQKASSPTSQPTSSPTLDQDAEHLPTSGTTGQSESYLSSSGVVGQPGPATPTSGAMGQPEPHAPTSRQKWQNSNQSKPRILIPLGGGKDSVVTLEIFRQNLASKLANQPANQLTSRPTNQPANRPADQLTNHHEEEKIIEIDASKAQQPDIAVLLINGTVASKDIAMVSRLPTYTVRRTLDPQIVELNDQGYLNGHVPISALFAFTSILSARLYGYQFVAISNERSSNEGNVEYLGHEINHQYSKTFEFEQLFADYIDQYFPTDTPRFFSYLRPLYELQIAKIFSRFDRYHQVFRSCNVGQKNNSWCGKCSKCLFAFIILYPFLDLSNLTTYFGENLLDKIELVEIARELTGKSEHKPFDCVGTHEESIIAFYLCWQKWQQAQPHTTHQLLQKVYINILSNESDLDERSHKILASWNHENLIPDEKWASWLKKELDLT